MGEPACPGCGALPPAPAPDPTIDRHMAAAGHLRTMRRFADAAAVLRCRAVASAPWPDRVRPALGLAELLAGTGDLAGARTVLVAELNAGLGREDPPALQAMARLESTLAVVAWAGGDIEETLGYLDSAHARLATLDPGDDLATLLRDLALVRHAHGDTTEGADHARNALSLRIRLHGETHPLVAADRSALAAVLTDDR